MQFRSIAQLDDSIRSGLGARRGDYDVVVGVPRSGLLAGFLASMALDLPLTDIDGLIDGRRLFPQPGPLDLPAGRPARVLVVDDSVQTGGSLRKVVDRLAPLRSDHAVTICAVYGHRRQHPLTDIVLEAVPLPRLFEWNMLHHDLLKYATVDLDGLMDGAMPGLLGAATMPFGFGLTSAASGPREEMRRSLAARGVRVGRIVALPPVPDADTEVAAKARAYARLPSFLYLAREEDTAGLVAAASGKPALAVEARVMREGLRQGPARRLAAVQAGLVEAFYLRPPRLQGWYWKRRLRSLVGEGGYARLRRVGRGALSLHDDRAR